MDAGGVMQAHDQAIIHGSIESNWRTPDPCFEKLDKSFAFGYDAAATSIDAKVRSFFGPDHINPALRDALAFGWYEYILSTEPFNGVFDTSDFSLFINPPFSKTLLNAYNTGRVKVDGAWQTHEKDPVKARAFDIANWAAKCWEESQNGCTIVGIFPFAPQTEWYRQFVYGIVDDFRPDADPIDRHRWSGHAAMEEWRLPHRISFGHPDGVPAGNAGVNSAIIVWRPNPGFIGPWQPAVRYWSYR